jgi:hypothetical protein
LVFHRCSTVLTPPLFLLGPDGAACRAIEKTRPIKDKKGHGQASCTRASGGDYAAQCIGESVMQDRYGKEEPSQPPVPSPPARNQRRQRRSLPLWTHARPPTRDPARNQYVVERSHVSFRALAKQYVMHVRVHALRGSHLSTGRRQSGEEEGSVGEGQAGRRVWDEDEGHTLPGSQDAAYQADDAGDDS